MSELLNNQVDTQMKFENINSRVHANPCRGCDENKEELEKNNLPHKNFCNGRGTIRLYQKTGWAKLWVTDSTLNENINSLINK